MVALARGQYDEKELVSCFLFLQIRLLLSSPENMFVKSCLKACYPCWL